MALARSPSDASGRPYRRFSSSDVWKRNVSRVADRLNLQVAHVMAVEQHATLVGIEQARDERAERRLPSAARADERDELAGLDRQIDVADGGAVRRRTRR